jgi:hypothetical protein
MKADVEKRSGCAAEAAARCVVGGRGETAGLLRRIVGHLARTIPPEHEQPTARPKTPL